MKSVVMGTAGHIDHGKTTLVKRLTGVDTDRLQEEKRRGMTIELGFAPYTLPSGNVISIIDVPGHEKFVKTMVSGVTGIDFVMLVVAADEGIMPQTKEHIDILSLLNVKSGVVALTKTDLVDEEWLELVKEDVRKALKGTTLENLSIMPVSSVTGYGFDNLVGELEKLSSEASKKKVRDLFRLPVDRVFTLTGHGTIITGTVTGGEVKKGQIVQIMPSGKVLKIRGVQVHNKAVDTASSGERCALNVTGVEKDDIARGDVVASEGLLMSVNLVDAVLTTVDGTEGISHNQRVHLHVGTKEVLARARLIGKDEIAGGETGYVQLRLEEPISVIRGDRFIIRALSPVVTIGGGWILFHSTRNRQRFTENSVRALEIGEKGSLKELVNLILDECGKMISSDEIWKELFADKTSIQEVLKEETDNANIIKLDSVNKYLSKKAYISIYEKINSEFEEFYKRFPFRYQIDKEEIKSKMFKNIDAKDFTALINYYAAKGLIKLDGNYILQTGNFRINNIIEMKETGIIEKTFLEDGLDTRNIQQLKLDFGFDENKIAEIEKFLINTERLIEIGDGIIIHSVNVKTAAAQIRSYLETNGSATAAEIRDMLSVGRKTAIALLEFLDRIDFTQRTENIRKPGVHFMDLFI